ncbi:exopolysaccharide biosynthesis protein [Aurantiacibacter gangjinensis]|nr:hypothetical protein [Aurantiacibacter gangjinensis]APE28553.1 exopolysaccharide biosynthesis protein [Aurantiacibacter gangjinensis]
MLVVLAIGLTAGIIVAIATRPHISATAQVEFLTPESAQGAELPSPAERALAATSGDVAMRVVDELSLLGNGRFTQGRPQLRDGEVSEIARKAQAAALVIRNTRLDTDGVGPMLRITYEADDAGLAADIANTIASGLVVADAQALAAFADNGRAETEALLARLSNAEPQVEAAVSPDERELLEAPSSDALTDLNNNARATLRQELSTIQQALREIEADIASGEPDAADPEVIRLRRERADLQARYDRLTEQFRPDYPAAQRLREQLDELDEALAREASRSMGTRALNASQLRQRELELSAEIAALDVASAPDDGTRNLSGIDAETRQLQELLEARLAQLDVAEPSESARIVTVAEAPPSPMLWHWLRIIGIALGAALLLCLGMLLLDRRRARAAAA